MKEILDIEDVWEAVEPTEEEDVNPRKDKKACAYILQAIPEDVLLQIAKKKTAKEIWESLKTRPTFVNIYKKGSVEQYSPVPYLATFFNCMLWVLYGLPFVHPNSILVITINGAGTFIEVPNNKRLKLIVIAVLEVVFVGVVAVAVLSLVHGTKDRSRVIGIIAIVGNIMMYAAPLSVMNDDTEPS
ncbi:Bidirectional sugar transporter SWEET7-like protein [Drosera capensis]